MRHGVLILHGFGGSSEEVGTLRDFLTASGFLVSVPLLPGQHNPDGQSCNGTMQAWLNAASAAHRTLSAQCDKVFIVGFSMGGLLAAQLQDFQTDGLVTVNTPVYYWNFKQILKNLSTDRNTYLRKYLRCGQHTTFRSMVHFQRLLSSTKPLFRKISCTSLILQAENDDTVHPCSADYIFRRVQGQKRLIKLPRGGHQIFQSPQSSEACKIIADFLTELN